MTDIRTVELIKRYIVDKGVYKTSDYNTFYEALADIEDLSKTLYIDSIITISSTTTIPENISVEILNGGGFTSSNSSSLVINGSFSCKLFKCFYGNLVVTISKTESFIPHWWGAKGDGVTDDTVAINATIAASVTGGGYTFAPQGSYLISSGLVIPGTAEKFRLVGAGRDISVIFCKTLTVQTFTLTGSVTLQYLEISDLTFDGKNSASGGTASTTWPGLIKSSAAECPTVRINRIRAGDTSLSNAKMFDLTNMFDVYFDDIKIELVTNGYALYKSGGTAATTFNFQNLYFHQIKQIMYLSDVIGTHFLNCIADSCSVWGAAAFSNVLYTNLYIEGMGFSLSGNGNGLSYKSTGISFGEPELDSTVMDTVFLGMNDCQTFNGGTLSAFVQTNQQNTTTRVNAAAGSTSIGVTATSGIIAGRTIGLTLDNGVVHWCHVSSITDAINLVIDSAIPTYRNSPVNAIIYTYAGLTGWYQGIGFGNAISAFGSAYFNQIQCNSLKTQNVFNEGYRSQYSYMVYDRLDNRQLSTLNLIKSFDEGRKLTLGTIALISPTWSEVIKVDGGAFSFGYKNAISYSFYVYPNPAETSPFKTGDKTYLNDVSYGKPGGYIVVARTDTTIRIQAVATNTTIEVVTTTNILVDNSIGILLDNGVVHWTRIITIVDSDTIIIGAGIPAGRTANVGAAVYTWRWEAMLTGNVIDNPFLLRQTLNVEGVTQLTTLNTSAAVTVSGLLTANAAATIAGIASINISRTNGVNENAIVLSDNLTGASTPGFGIVIAGRSNNGGVEAKIAFENGGDGTNNQSQISFTTQNVSGTLVKQMVIGSTGNISGLSATDSTSVTTGAFFLSGGLGMAKALWVGGLANIAGVLTLQTYLNKSNTTGITASTTQTQGQGALTKDLNIVSTVANVNDTVTLPTAVAGMTVFIRNNGAQTMKIFPASGDAINGAAVDASTTLATGLSVTYSTADTTNWYS